MKLIIVSWGVIQGQSKAGIKRVDEVNFINLEWIEINTQEILINGRKAWKKYRWDCRIHEGKRFGLKVG